MKVISETTYYIICGSLLVFTVLTYLAALVDLGEWNLVVALIIAAVKGSLIILFFMHARYSSHLTWMVIGAALLWLGILFSLTLSDYLTRIPFASILIF